MRKRILSCFLLGSLLLGTTSVLASSASPTDPLVSRNYLENTLRPDYLRDIEDSTRSIYTGVYDSMLGQLNVEQDRLIALLMQRKTAAIKSEYLSKMTPRSWGYADTLTLRQGSGLLLLSGMATAKATGGELIDCTAGTAGTSLPLQAGHRYLVGEKATVTISVQSDSASIACEGQLQSSHSGQGTLPFHDVSRQDWFYAAVSFAYEKGLIRGIESNRFAPQQSVNRAMLATILYRMAGEPSVAGLSSPFQDVPKDAWYSDGVLWCAKEGIVKGMGDGTFAPTLAISREQFSSMLHRYAMQYIPQGESSLGDLTRFHDAARVSTWAEESLKWAVGSGIMSGDNTGALRPKASANRAETATMLQRLDAFSN